MQQVFSASESDLILVAIAETPGGESGYKDRRRSDCGLIAVARTCDRDAGIDDTRVEDSTAAQGYLDSGVVASADTYGFRYRINCDSVLWNGAHVWPRASFTYASSSYCMFSADCPEIR
jgi:hypothetical protein